MDVVGIIVAAKKVGGVADIVVETLNTVDITKPK